MSKFITLIPDQNVCAPQGFKAAGVSAGIKKSHKLDLSLIYSKVPAIAAGVFTRNQVKAAPLLLTKKHLKSGYLQAIITNSGNANACTGKLGTQHAKQTAIALAKELKIDNTLIGVASTGVIGVTLPIEKILTSIPKLSAKLDSAEDQEAAKAIMTTDTFAKQAALAVTLSDGSIIKIGGMAKGSGMIHPNMATMLGFITTDADISAAALQIALSKAVNNSFNMISVDGDSSTNDMVLVMANKCAANTAIEDINHPDWQLFYEGLLCLCISLSKQIATDGEGATTLIAVNVSGAKSDKQAKLVAKSVVSSSLVKAAVFGNDANWGRIACAAGYANAAINPNKLNISLEKLMLFKHGMPLEFSEDEALKLLQNKEVNINLDLGLGEHSATAWGCDLTYDYVKINAAYRT
ncbi:MAG: bifunctional glutamate N-acetyltransferase/amino-acid acetyltransferase ArgJ [Burkholderiales bacterium]|nr:bifunctional glutamate N-acetyltransferase/amino-acid acetyltransferase ArgJ [Burkholderiales bacterium]